MDCISSLEDLISSSTAALMLLDNGLQPLPRGVEFLLLQKVNLAARPVCPGIHLPASIGTSALLEDHERESLLVAFPRLGQVSFLMDGQRGRKTTGVGCPLKRTGIGRESKISRFSRACWRAACKSIRSSSRTIFTALCVGSPPGGTRKRPAWSDR